MGAKTRSKIGHIYISHVELPNQKKVQNAINIMIDINESEYVILYYKQIKLKKAYIFFCLEVSEPF